MAKIGLTSILNSVVLLDIGRKNLTIDGFERQGRISFESGLSIATKAFVSAQSSKNPKTIIQAEQLFLKQELQFCDKSNKMTISSLANAIVDFDDAMSCLKIVESPAAYQKAAATYPTRGKYRTSDLPKDAVHTACGGHATRLRNMFSAPGMNANETALYQLRLENITLAKKMYMAKQRTALATHWID
jgi:hypothetical protein